MDTTNLILNITIWSGVLLGLVFGIFLNISAYKLKKSKKQVDIKSTATMNGPLHDSYTFIYTSYNKRHHSHKLNTNQVYKGNLELKSEYDYDCV